MLLEKLRQAGSSELLFNFFTCDTIADVHVSDRALAIPINVMTNLYSVKHYHHLQCSARLF